MWSHSKWLSCHTGHCWEGWEKRYPRHWQEKVSPFLSILRIIPLHFYCLNGFLSWQYNFCASETIACRDFLLFNFKLLIVQNYWFLAQPWALPVTIIPSELYISLISPRSLTSRSRICSNSFLDIRLLFASEVIACSNFCHWFFFILLMVEICWLLALPWALSLCQPCLQSCLLE